MKPDEAATTRIFEQDEPTDHERYRDGGKKCISRPDDRVEARGAAEGKHVDRGREDQRYMTGVLAKKLSKHVSTPPSDERPAKNR
jgi:hypothetical protein